MKNNWNLLVFLEDIFDEIRFRIRRKKMKRAHAQQGNAKGRPNHPGHYDLPATIIAGAAVLGFCAVLIFGIVKLIGFAGNVLLHSETAAPAAAVSMTEAATEPPRIYEEKDITLGCTGCMLLHSPFISSYPDAEGNYDYSSIYKYITPYYSAPDFMTCEFEGTLSGPEVGYHGYPTFRSPDIIAKNIRDSGVDLQMLATNHMYDAGSDGLHRTLEVYEQAGIACTGARKTSDAKPYYIADVDGVRIGFLNYVYETDGSGVNLNGIPVAEQDWELINSFDYDNLQPFYDEVSASVAAMRSEGARFIVANLHWGIEYQLEESDIQRTIAQRLCDLGVDALIGGHPHCEQPIDVFRSALDGSRMFCIFSVGNALSNQRTYLMAEMPTGHTEDGVLVTLSLHQDSAGNVTITDVDLLPTWVYRFQDNGSKYYILPLDDVDGLEALTGKDDIREDAQASYDRTMAELGPGLEKAKNEFKAD